MNANKTGDCCSDQHCDSGRRNRFYPNKRTTPDTWQVEQDYQQQRRRLLNRAIHGWGVVYGFALVAVEEDRCSGDGGKGIAIGPGLALDPCGRELFQTQNEPLTVADLLAFDAKGQYIEPPEKHCGKRDRNYPWPPAAEEFCFLLRAHYAERVIAPVAIRDPCHCEAQEWDQVCETVRYSLTPIDCSRCCRKDDCDLDCDCSTSTCCPQDTQHPKPSARGGCRCLCEHLLIDPTPECCSLTAISDVLRVDLRNGVPLACLKLGRDRCGDWTIGEVFDECGPRRLVKRNDLLFDLIRGCDLTRISAISWDKWHRNLNGPVDFDSFAAAFGSDNGKGAYRTSFVVEFCKPVAVATITPDAFTMTLIARDDEDGWGRTLRVPIVHIEVDETGHPGYSKSARILVNAHWAKGALDNISVFGSGVTRFEIQVRGDYLLDCNGQAVDANARGLEPAPTGNGTPGDTYLSTFLIDERESPKDSGNQSSYRGM
ncbi:MAG: hypothetical protein ACREXP_02385 [Steroidobacteraceae bacterium]